jgi:hypothetical protein
LAGTTAAAVTTNDFRDSTNIIDLRGDMDILMFFFPLVLGWGASCLLAYDWRERVGMCLAWTGLFLLLARG